MDWRLVYLLFPVTAVWCQPPVFYIVEDVVYEGGDMTMMCADFPDGTRFVNWYKYKAEESRYTHIYAYIMANDSGKAEGEYRGREIGHKEEEFGYSVKVSQVNKTLDEGTFRCETVDFFQTMHYSNSEPVVIEAEGVKEGQDPEINEDKPLNEGEKDKSESNKL